MKKLLVFSDTHGDIITAKKIVDKEEFDYLFYAGDWGHSDESILRDIDAFAVAGNHDVETDVLLREVYTEIEGIKIIMVHGHLFGSIKSYVDYDKIINFAQQNELEIDLVIHGHDHHNKDLIHRSVRFINPGSTSIPRMPSYGTYMIVTIDNKNVKVETKRV